MNGVDPISSILLLGSLGLLPIVLVATTSFIKFVVVLGMLRSAIGTAQIPPTIIITTLSVLLTAFVMAPVATEVYRRVEHLPRSEVSRLISSKSTTQLFNAAKVGFEPVEAFLLKNTLESDIEFFINLQPKPQNESSTNRPSSTATAVDEQNESDGKREIAPSEVSRKTREQPIPPP